MTDFFYQRDAKRLPQDPWIREICANENIAPGNHQK